MPTSFSAVILMIFSAAGKKCYRDRPLILNYPTHTLHHSSSLCICKYVCPYANKLRGLIRSG